MAAPRVRCRRGAILRARVKVIVGVEPTEAG